MSPSRPEQEQEKTLAHMDTMGDFVDSLTAPTFPVDPTDSGVPSPASDAVLAGQHPTHANGGPCETCAFRAGTEANRSPHTMELARLCVEGLRPFLCHEHPGLCRGFIAAVNLNGAPETEDDRRWREVAAMAADILGECIGRAREYQDAAKS